MLPLGALLRALYRAVSDEEYETHDTPASMCTTAQTSDSYMTVVNLMGQIFSAIEA
jgi:hypothetical protein